MIKNFVYLDVEKMYSLSSQIFEGVTEYILTEKKEEKESSESQKGPVGSGRILGDILKHNDRKSEKKFLNDYSYTLFEKELIDQKKVLELCSEKPEGDTKESLKNKSFVKIKGKATFNDIKSLQYTMKNFNTIGKALAHMTSFEEIQKVKSQLQKSTETIKDKNQRNKINNQSKQITNLNRLAKEKGLHQDQAFLDDLSYILGYGFQDQLEVQLKLENSIASANLKRDSLREEESLLIRKYARQTEVEFTLFGIVTQYNGSSENIDEDDENPHMKEALMNLVAHLSQLESTFTGRLDNEIIIDPIALYTEI